MTAGPLVSLAPLEFADRDLGASLVAHDFALDSNVLNEGRPHLDRFILTHKQDQGNSRFGAGFKLIRVND